MTAIFASTLRRAGLVLAFAVSMSALSSTSSFAFSAEAQQMCTGDAMRLCSSEIPNVSKITACMMKQRASLSSGCRTVMDKELAPEVQQDRFQLSLPACSKTAAVQPFWLSDGRHSRWAGMGAGPVINNAPRRAANPRSRT